MPLNTPSLPPVIALDGHAGAGKSTVAQEVARQLKFWHVNTGLYYRAVTWLALQHGIAADDSPALCQLARNHRLELQEQAGQQRILIDGLDRTDQLRSPEINRLISPVSADAGVRAEITQRLRQLQHPHGIIMDGRDIGTVVFPNAQLKIFLTASVEERARRQHAEALARGEDISLQTFQELVANRDRQDSERAVAPLKQAGDAILLDSTGLTPETVVQRILSLWQEAQPGRLNSSQK